MVEDRRLCFCGRPEADLASGASAAEQRRGPRFGRALCRGEGGHWRLLPARGAGSSDGGGNDPAIRRAPRQNPGQGFCVGVRGATTRRLTLFRWQRAWGSATPRSMSENLIIADGLVVVLNYTLRSEEGEVIDSSTADDPMAYLHGADNIVPGLEQALTGKTVGFTGKVRVEPEDGYGEREDLPPQAVPRSAFPADMKLAAGMQFMTEGPNGEHAPIWIDRVEGDQIFVDPQHPLAGKALNFDVEVLAVRAATADEMGHGHPHGPDGHGHHH